jgi:ferredoxin/flavodoxin---NADP+ reductase
VHKGLHKVLEIRNMSKHTFSIRVERNDLKFTAGQCVNIGLPNSGVNREYSSYSGEHESDLRFLIREVDDGQVSPKLRKLKAGDYIEVDGSYGLFTIGNPQDNSKKYVFIATGTGIAPFHCFVKSYPNITYKIIHGTQFIEEGYDRNDYKPGCYVQCVSREKGGEFSGRVTEFLKSNPQPLDSIYYLCGNRNMINEVYDILREQNVSGSNIITEVFF